MTGSLPSASIRLAEDCPVISLPTGLRSPPCATTSEKSGQFSTTNSETHLALPIFHPATGFRSEDCPVISLPTGLRSPPCATTSEKSGQFSTTNSETHLALPIFHPATGF